MLAAGVAITAAFRKRSNADRFEPTAPCVDGGSGKTGFQGGNRGSNPLGGTNVHRPFGPHAFVQSARVGPSWGQSGANLGPFWGHSPDQVVKRLGRRALLPRQHVPVDIHRERRGRLPEPPRNRQQVGAGQDRLAPGRMPQRVKSSVRGVSAAACSVMGVLIPCSRRAARRSRPGSASGGRTAQVVLFPTPLSRRPSAMRPASMATSPGSTAPSRVTVSSAACQRWPLCPDYELKAVCTAHEDTARASAAQFGAELPFHDIDDRVQRPDMDIVVVPVRVPLHHPCDRDPSARRAAASKRAGDGLRRTRPHLRAGLCAAGVPWARAVKGWW